MKKIKIRVSAYDAKITLPAQFYEHTIKALRYAINKKFAPKGSDELFYIKETLEIMEKALKDIGIKID